MITQPSSNSALRALAIAAIAAPFSLSLPGCTTADPHENDRTAITGARNSYARSDALEGLVREREKIDVLKTVTGVESQLASARSALCPILTEYLPNEGMSLSGSKLTDREKVQSAIELLLTAATDHIAPADVSNVGKTIARSAKAAGMGNILTEEIRYLLMHTQSSVPGDRLCVAVLTELNCKSLLLQIGRYHPDNSVAEEAISPLMISSPNAGKWLRADRAGFEGRRGQLAELRRANAGLQASLDEALVALEDDRVLLARYEEKINTLETQLASEKVRNDLNAQANAELKKQQDDQHKRDFVTVDGREFRLRQVVATAQGGDLFEIGVHSGEYLMCVVPDGAARNSSFNLVTTNFTQRPNGICVADNLHHGSILPWKASGGFGLFGSTSGFYRFSHGENPKVILLYTIEALDGKPIQYGSLSAEMNTFLDELAAQYKREEEQRKRSFDHSTHGRM